MSKAKKPTPNVTVFDLDAIAPEEVVIHIGKTDYPLKQVSVNDYIKNMREQKVIEQLADDDVAGHLVRTQELLLRAFPTMKSDIFDLMTMIQLNKLVELAFNMNGQKEAEARQAAEGKAAGAANPPAAGQ